MSDQVVTNPHWSGGVDVTFDGRDFAVIFPKPVVDYTCPWYCPREVEHDVGVMRISTSGVKAEPVDFTFSFMQPSQPAIAWNGAGGGLAIWPFTGRIFAAAIDRDLQLLTPIHEVVSDAFLDQVRVAFDGVNYVIAWSAHENVTPREIRITIVSPEGTALGETTTIASPSVNLGSVTSLGGGRAFVSYVRPNGNDRGRAFGRIIIDPPPPPRVRAARH